MIAGQAAGGPREDVLLLAAVEPVGTVGLAYADLAEPTNPGQQSAAHLRALYVLPAHRARGVGVALLRATARDLRRLGATGLECQVLSRNLAARRFYEAAGATYVGRGTFDEEGVLLETAVYRWARLGDLTGS